MARRTYARKKPTYAKKSYNKSGFKKSTPYMMKPSSIPYDGMVKLKFASVVSYNTFNVLTPTGGGCIANWGISGVSTNYDVFIDDIAEY